MVNKTSDKLQRTLLLEVKLDDVMLVFVNIYNVNTESKQSQTLTF